MRGGALTDNGGNPWRGGSFIASMEPKELVATLRNAALRHNLSWEALVPNPRQVDVRHEEAEELAYAEMAAAKSALRDHICQTYGISARELSNLTQM